MNDPHLGKRPKTFFWLSAVVCCICLGLLGWAAWNYSGNDDWIWVTCLLSLPFLLQIIGLAFLYRKVHEEPSIWSFYWYHLTAMVLLSIVLYAWIWLRYPAQLWKLDQYLTAILILVMLILLGGVAYSLIQPKSDEGSQDGATKSWGNLILLRDMQNCVSKTPFWALLSFFSIFLVVNYLFSFALAAHDFVTLPPSDTTSTVKPALYQPRLYSSEAEKQETIAKNKAQKDPKPPPQREVEEPYEFFFDSDDPYMIDMNSQNPEPKKADDWKWKQQTNQSHLAKLVDDINKNTQGGERLVIELKGYADDQNSNKFPSNHALSGVRASTVQSEILRRLQEKDTRSRDIQWNYLALSSVAARPETPLQGASESDVEEKMKKLQAKFETDSDLVHALEMGKLQTQIDTAIKQMERAAEQMKRAAKQTEQATEPNPVTSEGLRLLELFKKADGLLHQNNKDEESKKAEANRVINTLAYLIDVNEHVDWNAQKRLVVVSLSSPQSVPASTLSDYQRLGLLDFIYYTMTWGGNITPTTAYAKFLSASSKIVDMFFFIIFFNTLLSVKRGKKKSKSDYATFPTHMEFDCQGSTGSITLLPPPRVWNATASDPWITVVRIDKDKQGGGEVSYAVEANDTKSPREGYIEIAGKIFPIRQGVNKAQASGA